MIKEDLLEYCYDHEGDYNCNLITYGYIGSFDLIIKLINEEKIVSKEDLKKYRMDF